ncbi:MAG: alpha/beta fold hydrolase [Clostridium sp.]
MELFRSEEKKQKYFEVYDEALAEIPIKHEEKYINTDYGDTHVINCGNKKGKKLVMLHCMGFSSISWYNNLKDLSNHFDVYCVDIIGEPNRTCSNTTKIKYEDYMKWLVQILDKLEIEKANIVGWSFGGFLATGFVINHEDRVEKVMALSPASTIAPLTIKFKLKLLPALFTGKDKKINEFLKWLSGQDNTDKSNIAFKVFTQGMKSFKGWATGTKLKVYADEEFKNIMVPYYVIVGDNDPIYKKEVINKVIQKLNVINPKITAEFINGTHGFPIQEYDSVNKKIINFIL